MVRIQNVVVTVKHSKLKLIQDSKYLLLLLVAECVHQTFDERTCFFTDRVFHLNNYRTFFLALLHHKK